MSYSYDWKTRKKQRTDSFNKHGHRGDKKISCNYCKKIICEKNSHNVLSGELDIVATICHDCWSLK